MQTCYTNLLKIQKPVPEAASEICKIWQEHLGAATVRLWLYNKDFDEFDLLSSSCMPRYGKACDTLTHQLPAKSIAGSAFTSQKVVRCPLASQHPNFCQDPSGDKFFEALPAIISVPLVLLETDQTTLRDLVLLGILDVHFEKLNALPLPTDEDLMFLAYLSASSLARGHSLERKNTFAELVDIALDLVVPGTELPFTERKEIYYTNLIHIINKAVHSNCASIFVVESGFDAIRCCASTGLTGVKDLRETKVVYRKGDGATWKVFESNKPLNAKNIQQLPEFRGKFKETRTVAPTSDHKPPAINSRTSTGYGYRLDCLGIGLWEPVLPKGSAQMRSRSESAELGPS